MITRTARECEIRWRGEQHPDFNREPWTQEEVQKVKSLAADSTDGCPDWVSVAKRLGVGYKFSGVFGSLTVQCRRTEHH